MYTKALDQIKDSSVLYTNRALTYIKYFTIKQIYIQSKLLSFTLRLGVFKRAIIDCDFVLQKLDEKNMRAWIYRAMGYYKMGEMDDFEKSIAEAKKGNPKELAYIESAVAIILVKDEGATSIAADTLTVQN